jgi:hypothetical protein
MLRSKETDPHGGASASAAGGGGAGAGDAAWREGQKRPPSRQFYLSSFQDMALPNHHKGLLPQPPPLPQRRKGFSGSCVVRFSWWMSGLSLSLSLSQTRSVSVLRF